MVREGGVKREEKRDGMQIWKGLGTPKTELRLEYTLPTGQSFRWKNISGSDEYLGVMGERVVHLRQLEDDVVYRILARGDGVSAEDDEAVLADYFNLSVSLTTLTAKWSDADSHFAKLSAALPGARMLRQDPVECLFSFICSQNNHISRIHGMVNRLAEMYGTRLHVPDTVELPSEVPRILFTFPTLTQLQAATEEDLRSAGFGYRARYVVEAIEQLNEKPEGGAAWLASLRKVPCQEVVELLCQLSGVGPKVAACVALFSLDKHDCIPVDTHVWQLALRKYTPQLRGKTLTPKFHPIVQAALVDRFGSHAGWAHNTLFIAELASIKERMRSALSTEESDSSDDETSAVSSPSSTSWDGGSPLPKTEFALEPPSPATPPGDDALNYNKKRRRAAVKATLRVKKQLGRMNEVEVKEEK